MFTSPSIDDVLEGVIVALSAEVLPSLNNERAMATVAMMQGVLQSIRQTLPRYDELLVVEHNDMTRTLREVASALGSASGPEADRIRARAAQLGGLPDLPAPLDRATVMAAHKALGDALVDNIEDLDALQRADIAAADDALGVIRAHLGPRHVRDMQTMTVGAGMVGRG